jgi:plastocyanin domain-containing protein
MKKNIIAIVIGIVIVGGTVLLMSSSKSSEPEAPQNAVSIVDGKQIIDIRAKAGFQPRKVIAQAGIPTILRVTTKGTFDCSSSIRIPSMNVSKILGPNGTSDIDLGVQQAGVLNGSCGMGMYPFEIDFQ